MAQFDKIELAWAAGLFDGEGTVVVRKNGPCNSENYRRIGLRVGMTDQCVVERFAKAVSLLKGFGPRKASNYPNAKPIWDSRTDNFEGVQAVMCFLWTWLSTPKREQFKTAVLRWINQKHWKNSARAWNVPSLRRN